MSQDEKSGSSMSADTTARAEAVRLSIDRAFDRVPRPAENDFQHPWSSGGMEVESLEAATCRDWRELPAAVIASAYNGLSSLSPNAFRFYLPALLTHALSDADTSGTAAQFTVWNLSVGVPSNAASVAQMLTCYARLTTEQRLAVLEFLQFVRDCETDRSLSRDAAIAIEGYWGDPRFWELGGVSVGSDTALFLDENLSDEAIGKELLARKIASLPVWVRSDPFRSYGCFVTRVDRTGKEITG